MSAPTGKDSRRRAARKLREIGMAMPVSGRVALCRFCGNVGAARFMRDVGSGLAECCGVAACEKRMK